MAGEFVGDPKGQAFQGSIKPIDIEKLQHAIGEIDGDIAFGQKPMTGSKEWWESEAKRFEAQAKLEINRHTELMIVAKEMAVAIEHVAGVDDQNRLGWALKKFDEYEAKEEDRLKAILGAFGYENKDTQGLE
jgi:hypothetical protein